MSKDHEAIRAEMYQSLANKKRLHLVVELDSPEQAEELYCWMYYKTDPPMKSKLQEIKWDCELISREQFEALQILRNALSNS